MVNLGEGQYQINGVRFGRNTRMPISGLDLAGYGVGATDYQVARADELRFGRDTLQPATMTFTIGAVDNKWLPHMQPLTHIGSVSNLANASSLLEQLATAWKSDVTRSTFGAVDVLYYGREGIVTQIYGRPRKFSYNAKSMKAQFRSATAEFQRVDTLCYTDQTYTVTVLPGTEGVATQNIVRSGGGAYTWLQLFIYGPIDHPKVKLGSLPLIDLNYSIPSGKMVEINSYPWQRRVVNSDALNLRPLLINDSPYLDQIRLAANSTTGIGLSGGSTTGATKLLAVWREAYNTL